MSVNAVQRNDMMYNVKQNLEVPLFLKVLGCFL